MKNKILIEKIKRILPRLKKSKLQEVHNLIKDDTKIKNRSLHYEVIHGTFNSKETGKQKVILIKKIFDENDIKYIREDKA